MQPFALGCVALLGTCAAQAQVVIYDDALQNGFADYSYRVDPGDTLPDFANTSPTRNGSAFSIAFAPAADAAPNAIGLAHPVVDYSTATHPRVRLFVHGGATGGQQLQFVVQLGDPSVTVAATALAPLVSGGGLAAGVWREASIDLTQPPLSYNGAYDRIDLVAGAAADQATLYVEDVELLPAQTVVNLFADSFEGGGANPGTLRFSAAAYNALESAGSASITVERVGGSAGAASVRVDSVGGSATPGADYTALAQTLNWAAGDAAPQSATLTVQGDVIDEPNETVDLALVNATGAVIGAPAAAVLTIVDDDDPPPANALLIEPDVTVLGMLSDRFTWRDGSSQPRVAVLAHNNGAAGPGGTRGGELREFRYQVPPGVTRIVRASGSGASGFGYTVSHATDDAFCTGAGDPSSLGHFTPGTFQRLFSGRHHAILRFTQAYPRYCTRAAPAQNFAIPVTIDWLFATGRDHPLWAISWDYSGVPADRLEDDARGPYGELLFDGAANEGAHAVISGVAWGDRFKFTTTDAAASFSSTWTWNQANTIPYVKLWTTTTDATMGTVLTQTIVQQDAGGYFGTGRWNSTSVGGFACLIFGRNHRMPCDFNWPYQSINYSLDAFGNPNSNTNNTRLAWGTNFGFLGQQQYRIHGSAFYGGPLPDTFAVGWPRRSYSAHIVLDRHAVLPVEAQVTQVESAQTTTASIVGGIGTVAASGPAGVARPDTVTYAPAGYDPVYSAWTFLAAANRIDANLAVGSGTLRKPLLIVRNWTLPGPPSLVRLNGATLAPDAGYFGSVRSATQELWLTLNADLAGANNRVQVDP